MQIQPFAQKPFGSEYIFEFAAIENIGLLASISDNSLQVVPFDPIQFKSSSGDSSLVTIANAHDSIITGIHTIDEHSAASCASDGLKVWDLRTSSTSTTSSKPVLYIQPETKAPLTCLDVSGVRLTAGTELVGTDAGLFIWDLRTGSKTLSYIDSHNDDVTQVKFHPTESNALISGSTDGLVNVYDTSIADEDEAVYQTINHGASIHSAGFLSEKRIYALSHMETFSIYQFADPNENVKEPEPLELGDLRQKLDCEYVVDLQQGYFSVGSNNVTPGKLSLYPFINETLQSTPSYSLIGGHGEEVVRAVYIRQKDNCIFSGGEDGIIRAWRAPEIETQSAINNASNDHEMNEVDQEQGQEWQQVKDKRKHKHKHKSEESEKKKKKHKKDKRFEPY